jgi:hypothetical protein
MTKEPENMLEQYWITATGSIKETSSKILIG